MTQYKVTDTELSGIADAIRTKGGTSAPLVFPSGFVSAISSISGSANLGSISISSNGTYTPTGGLDGFDNVVVDVQGGAVLESLTVSQNGHYTPSAGIDGFDDVVVSVSGGGGSNDNFKIAVGAMSGNIYDDEVTSMISRVFYNNTAISDIEMISLETVPVEAFYGGWVRNASFPACVNIGAQAFAGCLFLSSINASLCGSIGSSAFAGCTSLASVSFPSCSIVQFSAFNGCRKLSFASFPICKTISAVAFAYCGIISAYFPSCETIGQSAFMSCSSLTTANFPECLTVNSGAFQSCSKLESAFFPVCSYVSASAFTFCSALSTISFPELLSMGASVFRMGNNTAEYNTALKSVSFPKLKNIGGDAFIRCTALSVAIYNDLRSIGNYFHYQNSALESLYLLASVVCSAGGSSILVSTPMRDSSYLGHFGSIYVPASLVDAYKSAQYWSAMSDRFTAYVE